MMLHIEPAARVFAALGDATRLRLLQRLHEADTLSISALAEGSGLSRQAVTKHLEVLAEVGLVRDAKLGRERIWRIEGMPIEGAVSFLETYRSHWEQRFDRLDTYLSTLEKKP
jgi:DNA-binding transcriptional ArsR family regulator